MPEDGRHNGPAEMTVLGHAPGGDGAALAEPKILDVDALYLQQPVYSGSTLYWLRAEVAGDGRRGPDGKWLQAEMDFELMATGSPASHGDVPRVVLRDRCTWIQLVGSVPPPAGESELGLVYWRLADESSELREIRPDGTLRWRMELPKPATFRDFRPDPSQARAVRLRQMGADPARPDGVDFVADLDASRISELPAQRPQPSRTPAGNPLQGLAGVVPRGFPEDAGKTITVIGVLP
jgi:hypothetical protein